MDSHEIWYVYNATEDHSTFVLLISYHK